jgi:curved DNA-binding protein CbpA
VRGGQRIAAPERFMAEGSSCRCSRRGTLYDVLQVSPWCEPDVIQAAYRALARTRHPDVNRDSDAEDQMRRLNIAYQVLSDPARRSRYDEELILEKARPVTARATPAPGVGYAPPPPPPPPAGTASMGAQGGTWAGPVVTSGAVGGYQAAIFDTRTDVVLPRSALYASVVIFTAILALVSWLIIDALTARPFSPTRGPGTFRQDVWSDRPQPGAWFLGGAGADSDPGLSRAGERWNR